MEISQNILKENVFGLMMMSQSKMLNRISGASAAAHRQLLFLIAKRRMISTHSTHFNSAWHFRKEQPAGINLSLMPEGQTSGPTSTKGTHAQADGEH